MMLSKLMKNRGEFVSQPQYAQIIGSLLHLMSFSRPDIAYAVALTQKSLLTSDIFDL